MKLTFHDGASCIGGNKIELNSGNDTLFLDFGTNIGRAKQYFDSFLQPRTKTGLLDYYTLGLIPKLSDGIYRRDLEPHADTTNNGITGLLLSHAHLDHAGMISMLDYDIPIITTYTTAAILKAIQDTSNGKNEYTYLSTREFDGETFVTIRNTAYIQRKYFCMGPRAESFNDFWITRFISEKSRPMNYQSTEHIGSSFRLGELNVRCWEVDHSIPGACAFAIETEVGWVVYTGDLRLHGKNSSKTQKFIEEASELKPFALITEGTHPDTEKATTEEEVFNNISQILPNLNGLVIADFGPRNIERLISFHNASKNVTRKLAITVKDAYILFSIACTGDKEILKLISDEYTVLYQDKNSKPRKWEEEMYSLFEGRTINANDVNAQPDKYVLSFSYTDMSKLIDINVLGGHYIYSSSELYDEEQEYDFNRLRKWLETFHLELHGDPKEKNIDQLHFHSGGHMDGQGFRYMINKIRPQYLIPIHSFDRSFFNEFDSCKLFLPENGHTIEF